MTSEDVVVTKFDLNAKEQTLKTRFLANQRPQATPIPPPNPPIPRVPDPQLDAFLRDMNESIRQQPQGTLAGELLKKQANMMQQQIDLLRENQQTSQSMMQNWGKQREVRREVAEVVAPIVEMIKEIKGMYTETKQLGEIANIQIEQLKAEMRSRPVGQPESVPVVRNSIDKFAARKAQLEAKVTEMQRLVDTAAVNDGGITTALEGLTYLRSQMQSLPHEFDSFEKDIQTRFLRMTEIMQKAKALPKDVLYPSPDLETAREVLMKRMGGAFDYTGYMRELDEMKDRRNGLMLEFKQTAPQYPLIPRPQVQPSAAEKPTKQTAKRGNAQGAAGQRTMKPAPTPQVQTRRTLTKKPPGISDILSDPLRPPPAVTKKGKEREKSPRQAVVEGRKPTMVSQETQAEVATKKESPRRVEEDRHSEREEEVVEPPQPAQPEPFQLAEPAAKKRIQPDDLLPKIYLPPVHPPPLPTSTPPLQTWERQTLDVLTDYVLSRRLQLAPAPIMPPQGLSRWLGPDQLNTLIREGLFVDSATVDRMGMEVLDEIIGKVKMDRSQREQEPSYGSDFEEEISEHTDKSEEKPPEIPVIEHKGQASFPPAEPANVSMFFPGPSPIVAEERKEETDIAALLSPGILGRMSASAVRQYIASLIEAGHIGPKTESLSPPIPAPQPIPQPVLLVEERKFEEPREEELEKLLGKEMAAMFLAMLREKHQEMTQDMLDRFARSFAPAIAEPPKPQIQHVPSPPSEPSEPQRFEPLFPVSTDFKDAFSLPKRLNLDLDAEEAKLRMEQDLPRLMLKLPPFRPPELPAPDSNMSLYLSASDSSIGGHSVGTELFSLENTEYMGSLAQFMSSARGMEEGQLAGNPDLSEGEVGGRDEALSSGELPPDVLNPAVDFPRPRINVANILSSDEVLDSASEGEFDPQHLFHP